MVVGVFRLRALLGGGKVGLFHASAVAVVCIDIRGKVVGGDCVKLTLLPVVTNSLTVLNVGERTAVGIICNTSAVKGRKLCSDAVVYVYVLAEGIACDFSRGISIFLCALYISCVIVGVDNSLVVQLVNTIILKNNGFVKGFVDSSIARPLDIKKSAA